MYWLMSEGCIHPHEVEREHFTNERFFDLNGTVNNLPDADRARGLSKRWYSTQANHTEELHHD